jgi:hypothetical protein
MKFFVPARPVLWAMGALIGNGLGNLLVNGFFSITNGWFALGILTGAFLMYWFPQNID